jgi:hypothetical protein
MAFNDYVSELFTTIPRLPQPFAATLINRAFYNIRDTRLWSWLVGYDDIYAPPIITAGTATVTQGSSTVTVDSNATTAINLVALGNYPVPPVASTQLGVGRQFRIPVNQGGPYYNIIGWNGAGILTLDRPWSDPNSTNSSYTISKCYYAVPTASFSATPDFVRYLTITNKTSGYTIRGKRLIYSQAKLNAVDPQRGGTGDAYVVATYKPDAQGNPVHEWYPNPVNPATYACFFQRRGLPLSPTNDIPNTLPVPLLMARAYILAADWCLANVATFPDLGNTNWVAYRQIQQGLYQELLIQCIKQDDELMTQLPMMYGYEFDFPLGGQFLQSHDVSSIIGGLY